MPLGWTGPAAVWSASGPHSVLRRHGRAVRNGIKIVGEESGAHIDCHGRRCVPEHLLHGFDIGARCHGEANFFDTANVYSDGHSEEICG